MLIARFILAWGLFASCTASASGPDAWKSCFELDEGIVRRALGDIESGHLKHPDLAKGRSGEVSRFQIMPYVWRQYSRSANYSNPVEAWQVARQVLKERGRWFLRVTGRTATAFDVYVLWNKPGIYERVGFDRSRLPLQVRDRALRFENLVGGYRQVQEFGQKRNTASPLVKNDAG